jgi:phospholipase A-2-activating protein
MPLSIDASKPWRLSHILDGHSSDVKSVYASVIDEDTELIHSASRDETGRSWYRGMDDLNAFQRGASYQGQRFQNAVIHVPGKESSGGGESQR